MNRRDFTKLAAGAAAAAVVPGVAACCCELPDNMEWEVTCIYNEGSGRYDIVSKRLVPCDARSPLTIPATPVGPR